MKIEKVIKQLESIADHTRSMAASPDADEIWKEDSDALEFALTALRSMQEAGEPLSLEQLQEMDGKPVWIVEYPDWGHWELSEDANDYIVDRNLNFYGMKHDDPDGRYGFHKLGWLAYSYPPAHIDRGKWEFCLWCKDLQYLPHEMCADVKMPGGSEIGASFCPSCGRPLTEEAWAELERRLRG